MGSNNKQGMIWEVASPLLLLLLGCISSVDLLVLMVFGPPDTGTNKGRLYQTTTRCAVFGNAGRKRRSMTGVGRERRRWVEKEEEKTTRTNERQLQTRRGKNKDARYTRCIDGFWWSVVV